MLRFYRLCLHALPRSFRNEYGEEMVADMAARRKESGALGRLLLLPEMLPDILMTAIREHGSLLVQDLRYAVRTFGRAPTYAVLAVVTIALGVGANTAIFTLVDRTLVRPLPFEEPHRLVKLWEVAPLRGYGQVEPSPPNVADWKEQNRVFRRMGAYWDGEFNLTGLDVPERRAGAQVTSDLFPTLGVSPQLGRGLTPEDDALDAPGVVVLGHGFWQDRLGGDPGVLGRALFLDGRAHEVVGVMPASFHFPRADVDFWIPLRLSPDDMADRANHMLDVVARLEEGVTLDEARAGMKVIARRLEEEYPETNRGSSVVVRPLSDEVTRESRLALVLLACASIGVLLIGCANLANLMLARASSRSQELAVRAALGAGTERLVRQLLTENLLLCLAGGALGLLTAHATLPLLGHLVPSELPVATSLTIDSRALLFAFSLSLLTGLLFALYPAWRLTGDSTADCLKEGGRDGGGSPRARVRNSLVVAEVAISVILLISSGLLIKALLRVSHQDPGFRTEDILTLRTALAFPKYAEHAERERFYGEVLRRVRELPGVENAGYTGFLPFVMRGVIWPVLAEGSAPDPETGVPSAVFRVITEGYLETLGTPVLRGRGFGSQDTEDSRPVALVSASFARTLWGEEDPLEKRFSFQLPWMEGVLPTVIGMVGDIKARGLERTTMPQVYLLHRQVTGGLFYHAPRDLAVRLVPGGPDPASDIRRIVRQVDPEQPVSSMQTMERLLATETAGRRHQLRMLGTFTALAFLMAALGIHGVLSYLVSRRTREIGMRMVLGARGRDITGMILGKGLALTLVGLVVGLAGGLALGMGMRHLLFGVRPIDAQVIGASVLLCLVASITACLVPAWRASRVDPLRSIKAE